MVNVYCNFGFSSFLSGLPINFEANIDKFVVLSGKKVAIFVIPFPYDQVDALRFEINIDKLITSVDSIIILGSELHDPTVDFITKYQHEKIRYFLCGKIQGVDHAYWLEWFNTSTHFYKESTILNSLTPTLQKNKYFDILLGLSRPHRDIIYNYINQNNFNDKVIMTYINNKTLIPIEDSDVYIWEKDIELPNNNITYTVTPVKYHGKTLTLSQVVPIKIYNQSAYSVVTESNFSDKFIFHTEKIVKPILAQRLFIVFGGVGYLQHLRDLGFKTFDTIIDESYDLEKNYEKRGEMICEQINYLINQDQQQILEQVKPIAEHNKKIMLETDWYGDFVRELRAVLLDHTN